MEEGAHAKIVQCLMSMFKDFKAVQAFVAFSNGSVVIFKSSSESAEDLKKKATRKMAKLGPDFAVENVNVMKVEDPELGSWNVLAWTEDILTIVMDNLENDKVSLYGKRKAIQDSTELQIIHTQKVH